MSESSSRLAFTATQWQELEHQALIFKYMHFVHFTFPKKFPKRFLPHLSSLQSLIIFLSLLISFYPIIIFIFLSISLQSLHISVIITFSKNSSKHYLKTFLKKFLLKTLNQTQPISGLPIPPDLLVPLKRSLDSSSLSSNLIHHQPRNVGWKYFQMGFGRKFDPEPGRCRRTDGKKWRCSKEAYPDSKYCERHMHRGRNRSRKPVEIITNQTTKSTTTNNPSKSSTPKAIPISPISKNPHPSLDKDYGYGNVTSYSGSSMDDPWQIIPNVTVGSSLAHSKQRNCSVLQNQEQDQYFHFLNSDYKSEMHLKTVRDDESQRVMHHFFDEWPKNRDSWLDSEGKSSNYEPVATTQLSISMPNYYDDFFMGHNGK